MKYYNINEITSKINIFEKPKPNSSTFNKLEEPKPFGFLSN